MIFAHFPAIVVPPEPTPDMIPAYVRAKAESCMRGLRREVEGLRSESDWLRMRRRLLNAYRKAIGPLPKRTPLNARVTGRLERPGVAVDKIVFESRPGFFVTGNLYLPRPLPRHPIPAVLLLSGHFEEGKADPASPHQRLAFSLAHMGVATFAIDPIGQGERKFTLDSERGPTESCVTEHCMLGYPCLLTGTNLIQYMVWDGIRAIDYLATRPEIDARRIAATGISGGGTQTFSLAPLDARVALAAPTCYVTSRLAFLNQAADAEQCLFGAIRNGLDHSMLIALCSPRRYQVQATRGDLFPIEGARASVALAAKCYALCGVPENLKLSEDDGEHEYTRGLRDSFYEALGPSIGAGAPAGEPPFDPIAPADLACTATGDVKTAYPNARWVRDFNRDRAAAIAPRRPLPSDPDSLASFQRSVRRAMLAVLGADVAPAAETGLAASLRNTVGAGKVVTRTYWVETEPGITVSCTIARRDGPGRRRAVLVLGDPNSPNADETAKEVEAARAAMEARGWIVAEVDVRGTGPSAVAGPPRTVWDRLVGGEAVIAQDLSMCSLGLFAGRAHDAMRCIDWLLQMPDVDPHGLAVVGWGQGGLIALTAAALDRRVAKCAVVNSLSTYRCLADADRFAHPPSTFLWNVLAYYDLPEAAGCIAPRPLLMAGPVDAMGVPQSAGVVRRTYGAAVAAYKAAGAADALSLEARDVAAWLARDSMAAARLLRRSPPVLRRAGS